MKNTPLQHLPDKQRMARAGKIGLSAPGHVVVSDKTRLARAGRVLQPVAPVADFSRRTHFRASAENQARYNTADLVFYEQCIRRTIAYNGKDGYANSQDHSLHIRRHDVTTWNPGEVFAPAVTPLINYPQNLWNEFVEAPGRRTAPF
ncbi:MAG TPA: hypothetical protein VF630_00410 [Hymenobacter sp.]|jgi:hypothetical protein